MESKGSKKEPILLPIYFKKIGLAVIILACVSVIIAKSMNVELIQTQKELSRALSLNAVILGLLFIAWSRDKVEDEMTLSIRLKSMCWTFIWAVLYVIIMPFIDLIFEDPISALTGQQVILSMLFLFLLHYYSVKSGR
jgi:hypothetical protein